MFLALMIVKRREAALRGLRFPGVGPGWGGNSGWMRAAPEAARWFGKVGGQARALPLGRYTGNWFNVVVYTWSLPELGLKVFNSMGRNCTFLDFQESMIIKGL